MALPSPFDVSTTAVLAIDLHRGYLDPSVSNRPLNPEKIGPIVAASKRLLELARGRGRPIIYGVLSPDNIRGQRDPRMQNPFFKWKDGRGPKKPPLIDAAALPAGRGGLDVQPDLAPKQGDFVIDSKSSMSCFYGTELDRMIRILGVDTLLIAGINTNTCVQCAAFDCFNRHLRAVVIEECVTTGYGDDLHQPALENIRRCLGWVASLQELETAITGNLTSEPAAARVASVLARNTSS